MTTETFLAFCYKCGLTNSDIEVMTIGNCLDYIETYIDMFYKDDGKKEQKENVRRATQKDFDNF